MQDYGTCPHCGHKFYASLPDYDPEAPKPDIWDSAIVKESQSGIRTTTIPPKAIQEHQSPPRPQPWRDHTPLMVAVRMGHLEVVKVLVAAGASLEANSWYTRSPLHLAIAAGQYSIAQCLIAAGADVNLRDRNGNTALSYAEQSDPDVTKNELVEEENFFCKSERYHKTLEKRKVSRQQRIAKYLREAGATEQGIKELMLVKAAAQGKLGEVEALIDIGAEINQIVPNYGTALLQAVIKGHQEIVATLLAEGAEPNIYANANPPIIKAAENGFLEIVRMLLDAGANPHVTDSDMEDWEGYTALDRAQMKGHTEIVQLLRARGGKRQRKLPVCEWRGLVSDNLNDRLILVQATVAQAAEALCHVRGATVWEQNVFEQEVELTNECFVIFQFAGHTWTVIHEKNIYSWHDGLNSQDAQRLSQHLQVKVIYYSVSDTAGAIGYELYESGELMEEFDSYCDHDYRDQMESGGEPDTIYGRSWKLYSKLRQINSSEIQQEFDFVDAFFKSQDAYVPAWGGLSHICGTGKRRKLQVTGLDPADLQMDYVAVQR